MQDATAPAQADDLTVIEAHIGAVVAEVAELEVAAMPVHACMRARDTRVVDTKAGLRAAPEDHRHLLAGEQAVQIKPDQPQAIRLFSRWHAAELRHRHIGGTAAAALHMHFHRLHAAAQHQPVKAAKTCPLFELKAAAADDTVSLNGTTTGGIKGDYLEFEDVSINLWAVRAACSITGVAATPWAATV